MINYYTVNINFDSNPSGILYNQVGSISVMIIALLGFTLPKIYIMTNAP